MSRMLASFLRAERRTLLLLGVALAVAAVVSGALLAGPAVSGLPGATALSPLAPVERSADADADGLPDLEEVAVLGSSPHAADTDADGLPDAWEAQHRRVDEATGRACPDPASPDAARDCSGKGLPLADDHRLGTDPWRNDTDGDALPDAWEATHGTLPLVADADADPYRDGLTNAQRLVVGARANRLDTACSGMRDAEKVRRGLDPSRASTGGSGVPDGWALHFGLDPLDPGIGLLRLDGDPSGMSVLEKALASFKLLGLCATPEAPEPPFDRGLDPRKADGDADGLPDAWEVRYGLDPTDAVDAGGASAEVVARLNLTEGSVRVASGPPSGREDLDGDGMSNLDAYLLGACPDKPDCDGDGLSNAEEALAGWDVSVDGATRRVFSDPLRAVSDGGRIPDKAKREGTWVQGAATLRFPPLDPGSMDTDGDGVDDALEVVDFAGVLDPARKDTDGDGLVDGEEVAYWEARARASPEVADQLCARCSVLDGGAPNVATPDADGDGLPDGDEARPRVHPVDPGSPTRAPFPSTDPAKGDTDGDGLQDAWEKRNARFDAALGVWDLDPSREDSLAGLPGASAGCDGMTTCADGARDLDADGLTNLLEQKAGSDPHAADSDADGLPDGWEFHHGTGTGARAGPAPSMGKGFSWLLRAGDAVRLSPTTPGDASAPLARYEYVRFSRDATLHPGERLVEPASDARPARIEGSRTWTLRDAYLWNATPTRAASQPDGLPDLYKAFWSRAPLGRPDLMPLDAAVGAVDPDGDGLPNAEEYRLGTSPLLADTDLGGLLDGAEREMGLDPRSPGDDAGEGDLDGDGLTNEHELRLSGTRVGDPDTDRDGLLDGADVVLPQGATAEAWLGRGILHLQENGNFRFRGEASLDPDPACARRWSCANDGLPDAWKLHHGLAPGYHAPSETNSADGLGVLLEYQWGRPANWSEEEHGPWWLGLDPTRPDTRAGVPDERHVSMAHLADVDGDGLHELTGEDPWPRDARNQGGPDVWDRRALLRALLDREAARDAPAPVPTPTRLVVEGALPATLRKGESFGIVGRVTTLAGAAPSRTVPVLARLVASEAGDDALALRSGDPADVLGVAFTDAEGRFRIRVDLRKTHEANAPADAFALFGPPSDARWEAATAHLRPGRAYHLVLWSHGAPTDAGLVGGAAWRSPQAIPLASAATFDAPAELVLAPGASVPLNATLTDGAGDPYGPVKAGLLRLKAAGMEWPPTRVQGANVTFLVTLPEDAPSAAVPATLSFDGDATLGSGGANVTLVPRHPTQLTLRAGADAVATGDTLPLSGTLRDARGVPLAQAKVVLRLAGATLEATTTADGTFDARLVVPAGIVLGAQAPTASYAGDRHHEPATAQARAVTVLAQPVFVDLAARADLGKGGAVQGRLLAGGAPVSDPFAGGPPVVRLGADGYAAQATSDKEGRFRILLPAALTRDAGILRIVLSTEGSALVRPASATLETPVVAPTTLEILPTQATRGEPAQIEGRLLDGAGAPVPQAKVQGTLLGQTADAVTDADGRFRLDLVVPGETSPGAVPIHVSFAGLPPIHGPSEATAEVRVLAGLRLDLARRVLDTADPVVRGRLLLDTGEPAPSRALRVTLDGGASQDLLTREDGTFSFPLPAAALAHPTLLARFQAPAQGGVAALAEDVVLVVDRASVLHLDPDAADLAPGDVLRLEARLTDDQGRPLADAPLVARLHGVDLLEARTDAQGRAWLNVTIPSDAPLGPASLSVRYPGAAGVHASETTVHLRLREAPHVQATLVPVPGAWELRLALRDARGQPLAGAPVLLADAEGTQALRVDTDGEGRAVVLLPPDAAPGITARFAGSESYRPASGAALVAAPQGVVAPGTGASPTPWLLAGLAALLLMGGVLALFLRHKRHAGDDVRGALQAAERVFRASDAHGEAALAAYAALVDALTRRRLLDAATATPREVQAALRGAFRLDEADLDVVVGAFEAVRYGGHALPADDARRAAEALARMRGALGGAGA